MLPLITGRTEVYCVLGHPVGHSVSPAMQNAALREMGRDGVYVALDVAPSDLPRAVEGLRALGVKGANCTIPHKEALVGLVDELSEEAALIGAVNTLVFRDGRVRGENTDGRGFLAALREAGMEPEGQRAVVLGAGGAARAVIVALAQCGASVAVSNRTESRAIELVQEVNSRLGGERVTVAPTDPALLGQSLAGANLLVNTTSLGMAPRVDEMPPVPAEALHPGLFVYDLIYNPLQTLLLRTAHSQGSRGTHGAGMLAHQGALALEHWIGVRGPARLMEQVILRTLGAEATV